MKGFFERLKIKREDKKIITRNMEKITGRLSGKKGGLIHLLMGESIGGNAGVSGNFPCAAANFYYDSETGEIFSFTNDVNVFHGACSGTFLVPFDIRSRIWFFKIERFFEGAGSSERARKNIERCVGLYNIAAAKENERKD